MPCPPLTKNLLSIIVTLGFYVIEQPGCWYTLIMIEVSIQFLFIHIQSYKNIYTIPSVKYSIHKFHCPGHGPKESPQS